LQALNGRIPGATLNVGVVQGGTRPNVVPAEANAQIDVRAFERASLDAIIAAMRECVTSTIVPDTTVTLEGGVSNGPMERTAATEWLLGQCREAAAAAGFELHDAATGGGSDGNTTAGLGVPTLDGLGPVGGSAHSPREYLEIPSIVPRTAMLAGLIRRITAGRP
jgi:glutamate carboxypeptidase